MSVTFYVQGAPEDTELNLANGNFCRLMELIGREYDPQDLYARLQGTDLEIFRAQVLEGIAMIDQMPALDGGLIDVEISSNYIIGGLPPGYYRDRLTRVLRLIDHARQTGQPLQFD